MPIDKIVDLYIFQVSAFYTRIAPKVIPILLCWPATSEADFDCTSIESHHSR